MRVLLALFGSLIVGIAQAAQPGIPANLESWRAWVLKDQEFRACPLIAGRKAAGRDDFVCVWPGVLTIAADAKGASLTQRWRVEADGWVPLPGDQEHWPQQVTVNGQAAPVVDRNGPTLWLTTGTHDVRAQMVWGDRPQSLPVPESVALIALSVDGKPVTPVQRENGALTLGRGTLAAVEADSVDLRVFRKFSDGIPGELSTHIRVYASGQPREEAFGPALPEGFVPLALNSEEWPARLDDEGRLHVQVQPGYNELTLTARASAPVEKLVAHLPKAWAAQEIWSYESVPSLRVTSISGGVQVDPRQADVPNDWMGLPAYALTDGGALAIEQRSRGIGADVANRLTLHREAWLDFSGDGWFARDRITGRMQNGWRFDMAAPFSLQRAEAHEADAMLVTRGASAGLSGVEWRIPDVDLRAGVRIDAGTGSLPVTGWQQVFDQVNTTLYLPYGYRLIAAPGTDRASGSWLSRWTLLDVFVAAIVVLLAARLLGWIGGLVAALYLLLGYQESGAPLWTLLAVLALALVARALPDGRLARTAGLFRMAAIVLLVVAALPFAATQLRQALYPQLESGLGFPLGEYREVNNVERPRAQRYAAPAPAASPAPSAVSKSEPRSDTNVENEKLETIVITGSRIRNADVIGKYSKTTVVQTGAGEPGWRLGNQYELSWSGPVLPAQDVHLIVASPWLVRILRVALVALLGVLLWRIARGAPLRWRIGRAGAIGAASIIASTLMIVPAASAQEYPPDSLLQQLRERLVEAPRCAPQCADIAQAQVSARSDEIRVILEVHAAERVAVPLPGDDKALAVRAVMLDGVATDASIRIGGKPWIAVGRGVHRIEIIYAVAGDRAALAFAMKPHRASFVGESWQANGLADEHLLTETLTLVRVRASDAGEPVAIVQQFPPYVRVTRQLYLDLEWHITNTVQRMAPRDGGFAVSLSTIAGEHVTTSGFKMRDGKLTVALADGEAIAKWDSTLDQTESIVLSAPALSDHAEVWRFVVSPTWHVEFSGVPESGMTANAASDDYREFEFHPLPGETLNLRVSKPVATEGATRAIDKLSLSSDCGQRAATHVLQFDVRASQGGEQQITLPKEAEMLGVTRDGTEIGAHAIEGKLSLPLTPGKQSYEVRFRINSPMALSVSTPVLALGLPAANIDLAINLPRDRWLLAAFGPSVGPVVLFWGELLVMIVLAWLLSRWWRSDLRFRHWLLLGLGFSTFSWFALAVVVVWLFALDWRARRAPSANWRFNLLQIGMVALTIVALGCLVASIQNGLLGEPDMVVSGNGSYARNLHWFADRSVDALPVASIVSLPLWVYNLVMLVWALWLAWAVVGWLRAGFAAWTTGGYWRPWRVPQAAPAIDVPAVTPPPIA
jgi:hypothetical protein